MNRYLLLLIKILAFPSLVFAVSDMLLITGAYWTWPWLDIPLHLTGGVSIAVAGHIFFRELESVRILALHRSWLRTLLLVSLVALLAVLWEVYEFLSDLLLGTGTQLGLDDTVADQLLGLIGGGVAAVWLGFKRP